MDFFEDLFTPLMTTYKGAFDSGDHEGEDVLATET